MNYVYILRCKDGSFYTGWTNHLETRIAAHNGGGKEAAKYTRGRRPVTLVYAEESATKSEAMKREVEIKKMKRKEKKELLKEKSNVVSSILDDSGHFIQKLDKTTKNKTLDCG